MSTIVLCVLVGSNDIVLKIQSVVIMHNENKYVSVIRDNRYLTLFIVSGKKTLFDARTSAISLMQADFWLQIFQISLPRQQGSAVVQFD